MLPVCPPGSTCHRRNKDGVICGKPLDPRGKHWKQCEIGPARIGRHDSLRDLSAGYHRRTTGLAVSTEQRVVAWDRVNPRTGDVEEARLDYATRDAITGQPIFVDATVTCAFSGYAPCQRARARKDGLAAVSTVQGKRRRYSPSGLGGTSSRWRSRTGGDQPKRPWLTCVRGVTVSTLESGLRSFGMAGSS